MLTTFNAVAGSAAVQGNQVYGPYGNSRYSQGTMGTNKGFTGQYADATGLDYYNARYYDPVVGLFLAADVKQGDLQGMNPYGYVEGNPETLTDPTGQRFISSDGSQVGPIGNPTAPVPSPVTGGSGNGGGSTFVPPPPDMPGLIPGNGSGDSTRGSVNSTTKSTQQKNDSKTSQNAGGCSHATILGLCVKDTGKFAQGSAEVLGSIALLIGAFIGLFQSGGLLWALAQAFQMFASGILSVMKNGISNTLNSLDGAPNKGLRIFLDALQFAADLATTAFTIISFWQNIKQIGKYSGNTFSASWRGFWKTTRTLVNKGTLNATTRLAATTVGNFVNTIIGGDLLINDGEQLISDIVSN